MKPSNWTFYVLLLSHSVNIIISMGFFLFHLHVWIKKLLTYSDKQMKILCNFNFFFNEGYWSVEHISFSGQILEHSVVKKKYLHVPHVGHQCGKTVYLKDIWQIKNYNDLGLNVFYQSAIKNNLFIQFYRA